MLLERKGLESTDIAAALTKVVQEQQEIMQQLQDKVVSLENALQFHKDQDIDLAQKGVGFRISNL